MDGMGISRAPIVSDINSMGGYNRGGQPSTIFGAIVGRIKGAIEQRKQKEQQDIQNLWQMIGALPPAAQRIILSNPKVREKLDKFYGLGQPGQVTPGTPPIIPPDRPIVGTGKERTDEWGRTLEEPLPSPGAGVPSTMGSMSMGTTIPSTSIPMPSIATPPWNPQAAAMKPMTTAAGSPWDIPKSMGEMESEVIMGLPPEQIKAMIMSKYNMGQTIPPATAAYLLNMEQDNAQKTNKRMSELMATISGKPIPETPTSPPITPQELQRLFPGNITKEQYEMIRKAIIDPKAAGLGLSDTLSVLGAQRGQRQLQLSEEQGGRAKKGESRAEAEEGRDIKKENLYDELQALEEEAAYLEAQGDKLDPKKAARLEGLRKRLKQPSVQVDFMEQRRKEKGQTVPGDEVKFDLFGNPVE